MVFEQNGGVHRRNDCAVNIPALCVVCCAAESMDNTPQRKTSYPVPAKLSPVIVARANMPVEMIAGGVHWHLFYVAANGRAGHIRLRLGKCDCEFNYDELSNSGCPETSIANMSGQHASMLCNFYVSSCFSWLAKFELRVTLFSERWHSRSGTVRTITGDPSQKKPHGATHVADLGRQ